MEKVRELSAEVLSEGEAYQLLRRLQEARSQLAVAGAATACKPEELDRAEAVVLTRLAEARMARPGGCSLAAEWLEKARRLDPAYARAAHLQSRLYLKELAASRLFGELPVIRETDNPSSRKKQAAALVGAVGEQLRQVEAWRDRLVQGRSAAEAAQDTERTDCYGQLLLTLDEVKAAMHQVAESAGAYADSIEGMFYSSDLLKQVQQDVRQLAAKLEDWENLLAAANGSTDQQTADELSALDMVDQLVGMEEIKTRVRQLAQFLRYRQQRSEKGWVLHDSPELHLVLMGNPGTGKTTLARLMARLYHELRLLERDEVIEVDRSQLIGAYVGQTEQRTMEAIKRAVGGVLFIDEAYSLKRADSHANDYGQAAIDTLVAAMTSGELAGKFVVILAGYPEEMRHFLDANPGLRSRFPETGHLVLPDYSDEQLLAIAEQVAERNDFVITPEARQAILRRIERARVDDTFGNARTVKNIVLDAIFSKARRMDEGRELHLDDYTILYPEDVAAYREERSTENGAPVNMSAEEQLDQLVGLTELKAELRKLSAYLTIQRERQERGLPALPVEVHAVFSGNPGTGKTTVARLYAQMLRESGYLKRGHLVTVSRADLVAGYVGQTALRTKRKIREALGGVLFIDEAYSLLGASEQDFGSEAINTLVDEMSRHADNLVVVLAGYPEQMELLMASNPGLASRFKKHFRFPDYTPDELLQILCKAAAARGYKLSEEADSKLLTHLQSRKTGQLEGNARLVHNLLQEAIQYQAVRLSELPPAERSTERLMELRWEDLAPLFSV
ncbi:MAG: AAA family ATPase [Brevibacillus sp.]|nr:AAA family ATPase [Brevibacillus sp.]